MITLEPLSNFSQARAQSDAETLFRRSAIKKSHFANDLITHPVIDTYHWSCFESLSDRDVSDTRDGFNKRG